MENEMENGMKFSFLEIAFYLWNVVSRSTAAILETNLAENSWKDVSPNTPKCFPLLLLLLLCFFVFFYPRADGEK